MVEGVVVPRPLVFGKGSRWYSGPSKTRGSTAVSLLLSVVVMTSPWRADDEAPEYMSSERWRLPPEGRGGPPSPICVVSRGLPILQRNWGPRRASGPRLGYALRMGSSHDAARGIRHDRLLEGDFRWGSTAADRDETHLGVGPQPELFVYVATNGSWGGALPLAHPRSVFGRMVRRRRVPGRAVSRDAAHASSRPTAARRAPSVTR